MSPTYAGYELPTWRVEAFGEREAGMLAGSIEVGGQRMATWLPVGEPVVIGFDPAGPGGSRDALVVRQGERVLAATSDRREIAAILAEAGGEDKDEVPF